MNAPSYISESWATLWEALADAQPDNIAVVLGDQEIRWSALDDRAARMASVLGNLGVGWGSQIGRAHV